MQNWRAAGRVRVQGTDSTQRIAPRTSCAPPCICSPPRISAELPFATSSAPAEFDAALIYYYFKNKQDLFDATVQFALEEAAGVHHLAKSSDADPAQVIRDWLQHSLNMAEFNCTILRIMMHYAGSKRGGALEKSMQKFYQREEMDILADSVRRGIASKLFRPVDPWRSHAMFPCTLTGSLAASMVRRKFDVVAAFRDLEASIWLQLNYTPKV